MSFLNGRGELAQIQNEVDANSYEVSAILERVQELHGKAVIFEKIKNYHIPLCANVFGTFKRAAMALETTEQKLYAEWNNRKLSSWIEPELVSDGPCKECLIAEENVNLYKFPILKWNPLDAAPYITLGVVISQDPETGQRNAGIYRLMLQGKNQLGICLLDRRHAEIHYRKAEALGKPLEIAVAIGLDPTIVLAAASGLKFGDDELAFAGALRGAPVKVAKCNTVNLQVPASAEVVIEGVLPPKVRALEGPFGESNGFYGKSSYRPVLKVKTITHRQNPFFQATYTGKPVKEEHIITHLANCQPHLQESNKIQAFNNLPNQFHNVEKKINLLMKAQRIQLPDQARRKVKQNWSFYNIEQFSSTPIEQESFHCSI